MADNKERWQKKGFRNDDTCYDGVDAPDPQKSDAGLDEPEAYFPYPRKIKSADGNVDNSVWQSSETLKTRAQKE